VLIVGEIVVICGSLTKMPKLMNLGREGFGRFLLIFVRQISE
jgi:hypothetical protein